MSRAFGPLRTPSLRRDPGRQGQFAKSVVMAPVPTSNGLRVIQAGLVAARIRGNHSPIRKLDSAPAVLSESSNADCVPE